MLWISGISAEVPARSAERKRLSALQTAESRGRRIELLDYSPSGLASVASERALEEAGLGSSELDLIIGCTETPRETTPSEAQRVGKSMGVKIPAFDIVSSLTAFAAHLFFLDSLKEDDTPPHTLSVSSACFSQVVDFSDPAAASRFGDGAGAMIVSKKSGGLEVLRVLYETDPQFCEDFFIETYGYMHSHPRRDEYALAKSAELLQVLQLGRSFDWESTICLSALPPGPFHDDLGKRFNIPRSSNISIYQEAGDIGSAAPYLAVASVFKQLKAEQKIVLILAPSRASWGAVLLQVRG